jgi:hypothetical protein
MIILLAVVIASSSFTYYVSRPESTPVVNIAQPAANSSVRRPTSVRGTLRGELAAGHRLWMANKAADENNLHPHETACNVLRSTWTCTDLFLGGPKDPEGKLFEVMVYDVDEQAAEDLKHYGERPKGNYDGLGSMPNEGRLVAYVTVSLAK